MDENVTVAQVRPESTLYCLKNIPLDNTYQNTIAFNNLTAQRQYFSRHVKYTFNEMTYIRQNGNTIRVEKTADDMLDVNYLMFQNSAYGDRWFYAFVTQINYVNDVTTELIYEIDVMQTWFFDFFLKECFVVREHSSTDRMFENVLNEGLQVENYRWDYTQMVLSDHFTKLACVVLSLTDREGEQPEDLAELTGEYNGTYVGAKMIQFYSFDGFKKYMSKVHDKGQVDSILASYMVPYQYAEAFSATGKTLDTPLYTSITPRFGAIDGYYPKNKKLYCYPYNFMVVDAVENQKIYRYELFQVLKNQGETIRFAEYCTILPNPTAYAVPENYENYGQTGKYIDWSNGISMGNFPINGWNSDTYKAWVAQNSNRRNIGLATGVVGGLITAGVGAAALAAAPVTGGASLLALAGPLAMTAGGGVSAMSSVFNYISQDSDVQSLPDKSSATQSSDVASMTGARTFAYLNRHITRDYARIIDEFFNMYGYKTNLVKVPNWNVRPHWTYCKTAGCIIKGNIPANDAKKICAIFDNGITHWRNGDEVGNYSLDNRPVSRETSRAMRLQDNVEYINDAEYTERMIEPYGKEE